MFAPAPSELGPDSTPRSRRLDTGLAGWAVIAAEIVVAAAIAFSAVNVVSERQLPQSGTNPGGVSQANDTSNSAWLNAVLAPADKGGLPENSVIMSWWSASTTLWYGQKVLGLPQHPPGPGHHPLAGRGQQHPALVALEQLEPQHRLRLLDLGAERGLGDMGPFRGPVEAQGVGQGDQVFKLAEGEVGRARHGLK